MPGAYVDIRTECAGIRSYSLVRRSKDRSRYLIAVKRESQGRGGSTWLHDKAEVGTALSISVPKGAFTYVELPSKSCFVAGGIGITPLLPMIERANELGHPWELHYAAASPDRMAFREQVEQLRADGGRVFLHFSDGSTPRLDVDSIVRKLDVDVDAHLYCCGPGRMVDAFLSASHHRAAHTVHVERFGAAQALATEGGYRVELARSGKSHFVPPGKTILDVLIEVGADVPYSCGQGVCGACQTRVLGGEVDHRDCFFTEEEKATNTTMLICCSGARSDTLILDL
jgi:vanillate O-demethylase ferredoxin subunit